MLLCHHNHESKTEKVQHNHESNPEPKWLRTVQHNHESKTEKVVGRDGVGWGGVGSDEWPKSPDSAKWQNPSVTLKI